MLPPEAADNLVWDEETPDILFVTELVFYNSTLFRRFRHLYDKSGLRVAFLGEAIEPDFNLFDYAIGFSDDKAGDPGFIRLPSPFDMFSGFVSKMANPISTVPEARQELANKSGFCSFLYSNPMANPMRDRLFHELSKYKRVDSLGKHLNNVSVPGTGYGGHRADCVPIKAAYKFSIASENSDFRGYTSEKLLTSLEAHTVPVYWGNPNVEDDVNPECFINFGKMSGFEELLSEIERIDKDDDLWCEMVSKPWLTPAQEAAHKKRTGDYKARMAELLSGKLPSRAPQGYHAYLYREHFLTGRFPFDSWKERLKNILVK